MRISWRGWKARAAAALTVAIVLTAGRETAAQSNALVQQAQNSFQQGDFERAARSYAALVEQSPETGLYWYRLSYSWHSLGMFKEAIAANMESERLGFNTPTVRYNLAYSYAMMHDKDEAFAWLGKALDAGFANAPHMETGDTDLAGLRNDERWDAAVVRVRENRKNSIAAKWREFDFWIGEWIVETQDGEPLGTNKITSINHGYGIMEEWVSAGGYEGRSLSYYIAQSNQWKQVWVSEGGGGSSKEKTGGLLPNGAMRLQVQLPQPGGRSILDRTTWTPLEDGRVRQVVQTSTNGGGNWNTTFDGYYRRKD